MAVDEYRTGARAPGRGPTRGSGRRHAALDEQVVGVLWVLLAAVLVSAVLALW